MFRKIRNNTLFNDFFGFENGIDISNETQVLYRRNVVIKNIIFVSNIVYTILMIVLSLLNMNSNVSSSNWVLTIILFPVTFIINATLKKMINKRTDEIVYQQIAMYFAVAYMFVSSIVIYFKLKMNDTSFGEAGYILLYYSLVVISLYQDKKMLKNVCTWLVAGFIVIHLTITYKLMGMSFTGSTVPAQILEFLSSYPFFDILFRTIILLVFMVVLYVIVSISQYMQDERRKELIKRKEVEDDFIKVVTDMFDVTLNNKAIADDDKMHIDIVSQVSEQFALICGLNKDQAHEAYEFSRIHLDNTVNLDLKDISDKELQFERLRDQTSLGNRIVRRLDLERKCEDLIRSVDEGYLDSNKRFDFNELEQIVLISDLYVSLRDVRSYKRPIPHKRTIEIMSNEFRRYFDGYLFERFIRFQDKFETLFDQF